MLRLAPIALLALASTACTTQEERPAARATQGVIVGGAVEATWPVALAELRRLGGGRATVHAGARAADATVRGAVVRVLAEPYDATRTILHVTSDDAPVAQDVQLALQRALLR